MVNVQETLVLGIIPELKHLKPRLLQGLTLDLSFGPIAAWWYFFTLGVGFIYAILFV